MTQLESYESLYFSEEGFKDELVPSYLKDMDLFPNIADLLPDDYEEENGGGPLWSDGNSSDGNIVANEAIISSTFDETLIPREATVSESEESDLSVELPSKTEKIVSVPPARKVYTIQVQPLKPYRVVENHKENSRRVVKLTTIPVKKSPAQVTKDEIEDRSAGDSNGCLSKNAIAARENRIKKKKYVQNLEDSVQSLSTENKGLREKVNSLESSVEKFETEVRYLRNVLANVEEISALVKTVRSSHFTCSSLDKIDRKPNGKRKASTHPTGRGKSLKRSSSPAVGGVCLHVNNGQMSLEFCPECSVSAVDTWNEDSQV